MPATLEQPETTTPNTVEELLGENQQPANTPAVLDVSMLDKTQRTVQYLQHAGLIAADDHAAITTLNVLKRANHAAYAGESNRAVLAAQAKFKDAMSDTAKLTEGGTDSPVAKLVDSYLAARVEHNQKIVAELDALPSSLSPDEFNRTYHRAMANAKKDEAERLYYQGSPELLNDAVSQHPEALQNGYMSLGKLAVETGIVKGDKAQARDMVDDTLAVAATHALMHTAEEVMSTSDTDMASNKKFSDRYKANIIAKADDTMASTTPINRASPAEEGTAPQLARIQALTSLLSAQLHEMTRHTVNHTGKSDPVPAELAESLIEAKKLVNEYRVAAMSLASHFLAEGPAAHDPRMRQQRENLKASMDANNIAHLTKPEEAERMATRLAEQSAAYLISKSPGDTKAQANISTLLAQAKPQSEQSMADRLTAGPAASHVDQASRADTSSALGK